MNIFEKDQIKRIYWKDFLEKIRKQVEISFKITAILRSYFQFLITFASQMKEM